MVSTIIQLSPARKMKYNNSIMTMITTVIAATSIDTDRNSATINRHVRIGIAEIGIKAQTRASITAMTGLVRV